MSEINVVPLDFGISQGLSCVKAGKFLDEDRYHLAVASQEGILKIIKREHDGNHTVYNTMDLTENGAIWTMESIDVDGNGVDEILVGGMKGAIVCLSAEGSEMWNFDNLVHQCKSAISGISIWKNSPLRNEQRQLAPISVSYSLDKTIRVFDREGKMQWSQMFS